MYQYVNSAYTDANYTGSVSFYGEDDGKYSGVGLVAIFKLFAMQGKLFDGTASFDGVYGSYSLFHMYGQDPAEFTKQEWAIKRKATACGDDLS